MKIAFRKALADLRHQRAKSSLLWVALAVGASGVMATFAAQAILEREIHTSYWSAQPAAIVVFTDDVSDALLAKVRAVDGVDGADAGRSIRARAELGEQGFRSVQLFGLRDLTSQEVSKVFIESGEPTAGGVVAERSGLSVLGVEAPGDRVTLRVPGQSEACELVVDAIAHDPGQAPGWQDNVGYLYVDRSTLAALGISSALDQLRIDVDGDRATAKAVARRVAAVFAQEARPVTRIEIPARVHPHAEHMGTVLLLLQLLSALSLFLGAVLVANLTAADVGRERPQIGIMKTMGGSRPRISLVYLVRVLLIAGSASCAGVILGGFMGVEFAGFASEQMNLRPASFAVPLHVGVGVGLAAVLVPLGAAAIPVWRALGSTVREALSEAPLDEGAKTPHRLPSLAVALAFRNALRRPLRTLLTIGSLAVAGAMVMTATNVYESLISAVDRSLEARRDDLEVRLLRPTRPLVLERVTRALPGVDDVEVWGAVLAGVEAPNSEDERLPVVAGRYGILAPPIPGLHAGARLVDGRAPRRAGEIVVNRQLLAVEPALVLGADTGLRHRETRVAVTVVGVVEEIAPPTAYLHPAGMVELVGRGGTAGGVRVRSESSARVMRELENALIADGHFPAYAMSRDELRRTMVDHFLLILVVLLLLGAAAFTIGVIGLGTTLSLGIVERFRELGTLRSLGASPEQIGDLLLLEAALMTVVGALAACVLMVPLTFGVATLVGEHGLHVALPFEISILGVVAWMVAAAAGTWIACWLPTRKAIALPVRDLIGYE
ncbi:MAG: ABC transporter permease [Myxococcota bacterium]